MADSSRIPVSSRSSLRESFSPSAPYAGWQGGVFNLGGTRTLFVREVQRFMEIARETLLGPVVSAALFMVVFVFALGGDKQQAQLGGVPYIDFLVPGLAAMSLLGAAFANGGFSLVNAKYEGNIFDLLTAPLSASELTLALFGGSVVRGFLVGGAVLLVLGLAFGLPAFPFPLWLVAFAFLGAALFALLGSLTGIVAVRWEGLMIAVNFFVTPMTLLSGTFYSLQELPAHWSVVAVWNPVWHVVAGCRFGMTGFAEINPALSLLVLSLIDVALFVLVACLFKARWRCWNAQQAPQKRYVQKLLARLQGKPQGYLSATKARFLAKTPLAITTAAPVAATADATTAQTAQARLTAAVATEYPVPSLLRGQLRGATTLARRQFLRAASSPGAWFGEVFGTAILAYVFLLVVPTTGYAPAGWTPAEWLAPGLLALAVWDMAFASAAYNILLDRTEGGLEDTLIPPLSLPALLCGWVGGVLLVVLPIIAIGILVLRIFVPFPVDLLGLLAALALGTIFLATLGVLAGLHAKRFDDIGMLEILFIFPFLMLSAFLGAPETLPASAKFLSLANPLGGVMAWLRVSWIGQDFAPFFLSVCLLASAVLVLLVVAWLVMARSTWLRS